ncbi:MAG: sensor histidine kinase [Micromonosporaceae bacterium]
MRLWLALVLTAVTCLPVALRRRNPLGALAATLAASVVTAVVASASVPPPFVSIALVLYMVAVTCRRKVSVSAFAIVLVVLTAENVVALGVRFGGGGIVPVDLFVIIAWMIGSAVRQRRSYAAGLQEQAASNAVAEERLRIARELHDVVAHSMTVVAVQAGFGQYVFDEQPAKARAALGAIQATSREALGEMQHMLGVLRQAAPTSAGAGPAGPGAGPAEPGADAGPPLAPAPGLADLDRLVARTADAGVHVDLRWNGQRRAVPAGIDLSAYRIVQEALTNAVKHARATSCHVTVAYGENDLSVEITDDGPVAATGGLSTPYQGANAYGGANDNSSNGYGRPNGGSGAVTAGRDGTGHGIVGMRERVHFFGGQFTAAPRPEGGFRVAARAGSPTRRSHTT